MGFQYNGKPRAPELLLRSPSAGGGVELIRAREGMKELFGNTVLPADLAAGVPQSYPYPRSGSGGKAAGGFPINRNLRLAAAALALLGAAALAARAWLPAALRAR